MIEINLLPWRYDLYASALKRKKYGIAWLSFVFCAVFILLHVMLSSAINTSNLHVLNLKNTLSQMNLVNQDVMLYSNFEMARSNQKKLREFFKKIAKADVYSVQINKIDYTDKQIIVIGKTQSIANLMSWASEFDVKNYQMNMLKFKLVIESM